MAYSLPPLVKIPGREMAGPTPWCNWVIPGQVIAGAYPGSLSDEETDHILTTLLQLGMNTFVCLQAEVNIHVPEHAWRSGHGLRPYIRDAQRLLSKAHATKDATITQQKIDFLHLPIIDGSVTTDTAMHRLAEDCCERVLRGERLYIHCWGGHGRTGTLVAVMLSRLYGLSYTHALRHTQAYHDSRVYPQGVRSPQTAVQRAQVRRLLLLASDAAVSAAAHHSAARASPIPGNRPASSSSSSTGLVNRVNPQGLAAVRRSTPGGLAGGSSSSVSGAGGSPLMGPVTPARTAGMLGQGGLLRTVSTPTPPRTRATTSSGTAARTMPSTSSRSSLFSQTPAADSWLTKQASLLNSNDSMRAALQELQASLSTTTGGSRAGALTSQSGGLNGQTLLTKSRASTPLRGVTPAGSTAAAAAAAAVERLTAELARLQQRGSSGGGSSSGKVLGAGAGTLAYATPGSGLRSAARPQGPSTPLNHSSETAARLRRQMADVL